MNLSRSKKLALAVCSPVFLLSVFVGFPTLVVELNRWLEWPRWENAWARATGVLLMGSSAAMYCYCKWLFARIGHGTTAPFAPPENLVAAGPYRYSRNPIYIAYLSYFVGVFLYFGHAALLVYLSAVAAFVLGFVVWWEEPDLRRRLGQAYEVYCARVPRWFGPRADGSGREETG